MPLQRITSDTIEGNAVGINELNVSDGNAGEFLRTNGAGLLEFAAAAGGSGSGGGGLTGMQIFRNTTPVSTTADNFDLTDTWTKPAGVKTILYIITGGGAAIHTDGSGGGGGGTVWAFLDVSNITSVDITVGRGGAPSTNPGLAKGNPSRFGTLATADGATANFNGSGGSGNVPVDGGGFLVTGNAGTTAGQGGASFWSGQNIGKGGGAGANDQGNGVGENGIALILEFGGPEETTSSGGGGGASTSSIRGSLASYTSGGETTNGGGGTVATKEKYTYASNSNEASIGELIEPGTFTSCQSATHGYSGKYDPPSTSQTVSKFPFANDSVNAEQVADMHQNHTNGTTAHTSETQGYWAGGFPPSDGGSGRRISKFLFASESTTSSHGTLPTPYGAGVAGASNLATGGFIWGNFPDQIFVSKFSFASDNESNTHTQLSQAQRDATGQSGELFAYSVSGVFSGGSVVFLTTIDKFSYTSDSFQANVANCSIHQLASGTASVFDNGYTTGGTNNGIKSTAIRINSHASDSDETDISNLSVIRSHFGGCGACN